VSVAVRKLDGVETVVVSLEKSSADIVLKPGNRVTLPQLRAAIRRSGYPTRDAQITARGAIIDQMGRPVLDLLNGSVLELTERPTGSTPETTEISGVSRVIGKDNERLTIGPVKKQTPGS
jgi:copper chaperone CopZ